MPIMERAGSRDARTVTYQCPACHHKEHRQLGRPGDRTYSERVICPRCLHLQNDAEHRDAHKWENGFDGQRYAPKFDD